MDFDLYIWASPRDLDPERAASLIGGWEQAGGDPAVSPFEPSTDVGWFARELRRDEPGLALTTDADPNPIRTPIVLSGSDEPPARVVAIHLADVALEDAFDTIFSLAAKYDLIVFDARARQVRFPLAEMAAHASATFWPGGAIRAAVAGGLGGVVAIGGWLVGIPIVSGVVALGGGFMFVMAIYTFVHEGRTALARRRQGARSGPGATHEESL
ncbi:MAG TPA: hypothetical protein VGJ71_05685 [Candidatus Limnocylindrales bacterium]